MKLEFSLQAWSAWSSSKNKKSEWLDWANGRNFTAQGNLPDISMVPAMKRRRMSSLSKMVFSTALGCMDECQLVTPPHCIFASQHAEMARTLKILGAIAARKDVSPTDFSLSVHSTALGLFSIFTENKQASTMVVAGLDTFGMALVEASIYLARFPEVPVLLVFFDEPLPEPLSAMEDQAMEAFSFAFVLSGNEPANFSMSYEYNEGESIDEGEVNLGMSFLKFYLSGQLESQVKTDKTLWHWQRL